MNIRKRRSDRSGRVRVFSPGRPPVAGREERRRFWAAIAAGAASEDAAVGVGVPQAVGTRWFRKAGGMPPSMFGLSAKPLCRRYLSFAEREEIALLRVQGYFHAGGTSLAGSGEWHRQSPESWRRKRHATRKRRPRVSCDDSAMAPPSRGCSPPKARAEACAQRGVKNLCRGTVGWRRRGSERGSCSEARSCPGKAVGTDLGRTGHDGQTPGARSRSPVACRWTSRTTRPCASAMKPSIKRCSFKVEARCAAN